MGATLPCPSSFDLPTAEVWRTCQGQADRAYRIKERKAGFGLDAFNMRDLRATEAASGFALRDYNLMSLLRQAALRYRIQLRCPLLMAWCRDTNAPGSPDTGPMLVDLRHGAAHLTQAGT